MTARCALLSVSDKTGIIDLARALAANGYRLLSTGGTASALRDAALEVTEVADFTDAAEMLGGRVKTLHPRVFGGILAREDTPSDVADVEARGLFWIDVVVCNLYPFRSTVAREDCTFPLAIENIDIGGVTLLRAAAKNHARVSILSDPSDYAAFIAELPEISQTTRQALALKAFEHTAEYDDAISGYLRNQTTADAAPRARALRYGMNPHQKGASVFRAGGPLPFKVLNGSPGFINLCDALNAWALVKELDTALGLPAAASFKHVSPAGAAVAVPLTETEAIVCAAPANPSPLCTAYVRARGADRMSSFGDFIALSRVVDESTAAFIALETSDGVIAPGYEPAALAKLAAKKGGAYCILEMDGDYVPTGMERRTIFGVTLEQPRNDIAIAPATFSEEKVASHTKELSADALRDLTVATLAIKYAQSNSVAYAHHGQVVGLGAGQQSRIHCTRLAGEKADLWRLRHHPRAVEATKQFVAGTKRADKANAIDLYVTGRTASDPSWASRFTTVPEPLTAEERDEWLKGAHDIALASDAFFPFSDNVHRAAESGVQFIAAPMGSQGDANVLEAANSHQMVFVNTGMRLFHH